MDRVHCVQSFWFLLVLILLELNSVQSIGGLDGTGGLDSISGLSGISALDGLDNICDWSDSKCLTKAAKKIHKALVSGHKSPVDPLFTAKRTEDFETLNYELSNITLTGLRNCRVILLRFDGLKLAFEYYLYCPKIIFDFTYDAYGPMGDITFDGVGMAKETTENFFITLKGKSDVFLSTRDHKPRIAFKDLKVVTNLKGKYTFENKKHLRGVKAHFDMIPTWLNDIVKDKGDAIEYQTLIYFMTLYIEQLNKYLRDTPLEEVFASI